MTKPIEIRTDNIPQIKDWLTNRGGVAVWHSIDLRTAGEYVLTPALTRTGKPTTPPSWQSAKTPEIITDPAQILVYQEALFKAVPVALRRSSNGLSFKLTDASQRKVDRLMEQCRDKHGSAHYRKGVLPDKTASIGVFYTTHTEPLT